MLTSSVLAGAAWVGAAAAAGLVAGAAGLAASAGFGASVGLAAGGLGWAAGAQAASRPVPKLSSASEPPARSSARRETAQSSPLESVDLSIAPPLSIASTVAPSPLLRCPH